MPGKLATVLNQDVLIIPWPKDFLSKMLFHENLEANFDLDSHAFSLGIVADVRVSASCHPNAIMTMNLISDADYDEFEDSTLQFGDQAQAHVDTARGAIEDGDRAIWVRYGAHSFVLMSHPDTDRVESVEAWAGGHATGYPFHRSVEPQQADRVNTDKDEARAALQNLLDADPAIRRQGVDALSRAGLGGFGGVRGANHCGINVHVANLNGFDAIVQEIRSRLPDVGYWGALALEQLTGLDDVKDACACYYCHKTDTRPWFTRSYHSWRECRTCKRKYCYDHKLRLVSAVDDNRVMQRTCVCGQPTIRLRPFRTARREGA